MRDSTLRGGLHDLVVIGGSAGAVAPLRAILAGLSPESPAAILVVLHTSRGGSLAARIGPAPGPLPLVLAEDGMAIRPGRVYLAAADRHLLVEPGTIRLGRGPREHNSRPAIDALFRSAALSYGPRVVGVLLSGFLRDGTAGLAAIKRCGGLALVQDPDDAETPDMPAHALAAMPVDARAPGAELGTALARLIALPAGPPGPAPNDLALDVAIAAGTPARDGRPERGAGRPGEDGPGASLPEAMGVALRIVAERAALVRHLAEEARRRGNGLAAAAHRERALEYDGYVRTIRRALDDAARHDDAKSRWNKCR